jgi:predicted lactoylglutathione lyase
MIGYVTIGSNDLTAAAVFFDELFNAMGGSRAYSLDHMIAYTFGPDTPMILVNAPHNGETATVGNGSMIALALQDRAQVNALHAQAIELGAVNEGSPGPRGQQFYGGYFRDLDSNKFNVFVSP